MLHLVLLRELQLSDLARSRMVPGTFPGMGRDHPVGDTGMGPKTVSFFLGPPLSYRVPAAISVCLAGGTRHASL